jgi:hypothetical protein
MAKPTPSPVATTARTWTATLADGRTIQFSSPIEQLVDRLTHEARAERTTITGIAPGLPFAGWDKLRHQIIIKAASGHAMTIPDAKTARAA